MRPPAVPRPAIRAAGVAAAVLLPFLLPAALPHPAAADVVPAAGHEGRAAAAQGAPLFALAGDWPLAPAPESSDPIPGVCPYGAAVSSLRGAGFGANGALYVVATCGTQPYATEIEADGTFLRRGGLGWSWPSAATFEPATERFVGAFRNTSGRIVIAAEPLPGSAYPARTWNVPGGGSDDKGIPLALAPGPAGSIVAFSLDGLTSVGPGIERTGPAAPLGASGQAAKPGTVAADGAGGRYVLDPTMPWGVVKLAPDGRRVGGWAVEGLAGDAAVVAGYPDGDHLGALEPTITGTWRLRAFRPDGGLAAVRPVHPDLAAGRAPLLAIGPGGEYAVLLQSGLRVQIAWHAGDGTLRRWIDVGPDTQYNRGTVFGMNVSAAGGRAVVRWSRRRELVRFDRAGVSATLFAAPPRAEDVLAAPGGDVIVRRRRAMIQGGVTRGSDTVERYDAAGQIRWTTAISDAGAGLATDGVRVYVAQSEHSAVLALDAADGAPAGRIDLAADEGYFPADLALAPDGAIATIDPGARRLQVWDARTPFRPVRTFALPLADGVGRVAAGPGGLTSVLGRWTDSPAGPGQPTADVRVLDATGAEAWRLSAEPGIDLKAFAPADVAFDAGGRLLVAAEPADPRAPARLWAFDLSGAAAAPPPPPTPVPPPLANTGPCRVAGDKTAAPGAIWLGETVTVTLTLRRACPDVSSAADIVLVVDVSGSMGGPNEMAAADAVRAFVADIDLARHRIGLVTFSSTAKLLHPLSSDPAVVRDVPRSYGSGGGTNIAAALTTADEHLSEAARPGARQVIVLFSDGGSDANQAMAAAMAARRRGVRIFTIGVQGADSALLLRIAGRPEQHYGDLRPEDLPALYRQLATLIASGAGAAVLDDTLSPDVDLVPATFNRPPQIAFGAGLRWGLGADFGAPVTLTYQVRPLRTGVVPTNTSAWFDYLDGDGVVRRFTYPVPEVLVRAPSPTPTPSPTATPTPTPTATPVPRPIYLPIALREPACKPSARHADVALVIDASTSMREPAPSGRAKLDIALDGVRGFLDRLDLVASAGGATATPPADASDRDRAAVVAFNDAAALLQPLTSDRANLDAALGRITVAAHTCIVCGLEVAVDALAGARRDAAHTRVIVLLTDGRSNPRPIADAEAVATAARGRGIVVFTIALGDDVDAEALAGMASQPSFAFRAPTADDLAAIYGAVAGAIPCPAGAYWGGR